MSIMRLNRKINEKLIRYGSLGLLRKIFFSCLIGSIVAFFSIPGLIFADEGDVEMFVGAKDMYGSAGQYIAGDSQDTINDNSSNENGGQGDGDTEIFCIDHDHYVNYGEKPYGFTGDTVSEELISDGDSEVDAYALEILAKEATGAASVEDQSAAWQLTNNTYGITVDTNASIETNWDKEDIDAIVEATRDLAEEYLKPGGAKDQGKTLDEFLENDKDVNEIDVTIDQDHTIFEAGGSGTAIATMAEPLVPGITDENKNIYWYILADAFNISFSPSELILETFSGDAKTDADRMKDYTDDSNDNDEDGIADSTDHYGKSTVSYYYYLWTDKDGNELFPENTMGVGLFAWVDVDDDGKYDIVDVGYDEDAEEGEDLTPDGDIVGDFQNFYKVVQSETNSGGDEVIKTDTEGNVVSEPISVSHMDIHAVEGGQVLKKIQSQSNDSIVFDDSRQTLATLSYNEPIDDDPQFFGTILFKYTGDNVPLSDASFGLFNNPEVTGDPVMILRTNDSGYAATGNVGIEYGTWYLREIEPPAGYDANLTVYKLNISGNGVYAGMIDSDELYMFPFSVENTKTPPNPPDDPEDPDTPDNPETPETVPDVTVDGVASISVLAFTGLNPAIPMSGMGIIISGLGLVITSVRKRSGK